MKNIAINPEDYTILAVDDIATNIMLLKAVLSRAKYKIVTASGGYEAIEKASKEAPDLILLDIMMPDLDGYEVIKHLKADPATQDIPVIFLTALHNPEDIVKGFKLGASDYVSKPFNHEELITRVTHHIYLAAAQRTIMQQRDGAGFGGGIEGQESGHCIRTAEEKRAGIRPARRIFFQHHDGARLTPSDRWRSTPPYQGSTTGSASQPLSGALDQVP